MAEDTYLEVPYTATDGKEIILRSPDGMPRSGIDFETYAKEYESRITTAPGRVFEAVNQLVQSGNRAVQSALPGPSLYEGFNRSPQQIEAEKQLSPLEKLQHVAGGVGKTVSQFAANQFDTPGEVGTMAGLALTHPMVRNLSGTIPHIARTAGAAVGNLAGNVLTDPVGVLDKHITEALLTLVASGASETVTGVIANRFGHSLSEKATRQVKNDIFARIRQKYPDISLEGDSGIEAYASTKGGFEDLIKAGAKGLKADGEDLAKSFVADINLAMPRTMSQGTTKQLESLMNKYGKQADKYLDNLGDEAIEEATFKLKAEISKEMTDLVAKEFKSAQGQLDPAKVAILEQTWAKYQAAQNKFESGARVLTLMRESGEGGGFDAQRLQKTIHNRLSSKDPNLNDALMQSVMDAARRGAPRGSIDKSTKFHTELLPGWMSKSEEVLETPLTRFVGAIRGKVPHGVVNAITNEEIKKFALRSNEEKRR